MSGAEAFILRSGRVLPQRRGRVVVGANAGRASAPLLTKLPSVQPLVLHTCPVPGGVLEIRTEAAAIQPGR